MTHPRSQLIQAEFFLWRIYARKGMWYADGRTNRPSLGRHSLGGRTLAEAREAVRELDRVKAREQGRQVAELELQRGLPLEDGRAKYEEYASRPRVSGGIKASSAKRYKAVFDKFLRFARKNGITAWDQVDTQVLLKYSSWLNNSDYSYRSQYLEITTLKQVSKWLAKRKLISTNVTIDIPLRKPRGTDTYCWTQAEVTAILEHCRGTQDLRWLGDVLLALATTGLRISELIALRWTDLDLDAGMIRLKDETATRSDRVQGQRRTTKSSRDRSLPIAAPLKEMLLRLPHHRDGYIFHGPLGVRLKADTVRNVFLREVIAPFASTSASRAQLASPMAVCTVSDITSAANARTAASPNSLSCSGWAMPRAAW